MFRLFLFPDSHCDRRIDLYSVHSPRYNMENIPESNATKGGPESLKNEILEVGIKSLANRYLEMLRILDWSVHDPEL